MFGKISAGLGACLIFHFLGMGGGALAEGEKRPDPKTARSYFRLGYEYYRSGASARALEQLRKASHYDPGNAEIHYSIGIVLLSMDRPGEAKESFLKSLKSPRAFDEKADFETMAREGIFLIEEGKKKKRAKRRTLVLLPLLGVFALLLLFFTFRQFRRFSRGLQSRYKELHQKWNP